MVLLTFSTLEWDTASSQPVSQVVAKVSIDPQQLTYDIEGDARYFDSTIPLRDPATGTILTFESNPQSWAEHLQQAYRSGDIAIVCQNIP